MKNAQKILHVFSTLAVGGPQRRFADYLAGSKKPFDHKVYAMDGRYDALTLMEGIEKPDDQPIPKGDTWAAVKAARAYLKREKPDLLVTYNWGATEWVLANKYFRVCPMLHIQDGFNEDETGGETGKRRWMRRFAYKGCNGVVVPSHTLARLARQSWGISKKKLHYIPNGIVSERFKAPFDQAYCDSLGIREGTLVIGTVAALRPEKNIGRLIEAFSLLEDSHSNCQLVIVGDGIGLPALKMLAERVCRKGNVVFAGNEPKPERLLSRFDIFALSSDTEQMPLSVLEAMATGLPIVATRVGDVAKMVSSDNEPYIAGSDAKVLSANLLNMLAAPDIREAIGEANREKVSRDYELETMIEAYDTLFANTAGV